MQWRQPIIVIIALENALRLTWGLTQSKRLKGAINRRPLTFIQCKNLQNKSWMRHLSAFDVANFTADTPPEAPLWYLGDLNASCFSVFILLIPAASTPDGKVLGFRSQKMFIEFSHPECAVVIVVRGGDRRLARSRAASLSSFYT